MLKTKDCANSHKFEYHKNSDEIRRMSGEPCEFSIVKWRCELISCLFLTEMQFKFSRFKRFDKRNAKWRINCVELIKIFEHSKNPPLLKEFVFAIWDVCFHSRLCYFKATRK